MSDDPSDDPDDPPDPEEQPVPPMTGDHPTAPMAEGTREPKTEVSLEDLQRQIEDLRKWAEEHRLKDPPETR
jgi:hypothetical protein